MKRGGGRGNRAGNDEDTDEDVTLLEVGESKGALQRCQAQLQHRQGKEQRCQAQLRHHKDKERQLGNQFSRFSLSLLKVSGESGGELKAATEPPNLAQLLAPRGPEGHATRRRRRRDQQSTRRRRRRSKSSNGNALDAAPALDAVSKKLSSTTIDASHKAVFQHGFNLGYEACGKQKDQQSTRRRRRRSESSNGTALDASQDPPSKAPSQTPASEGRHVLNDGTPECPEWTKLREKIVSKMHRFGIRPVVLDGRMLPLLPSYARQLAKNSSFPFVMKKVWYKNQLIARDDDDPRGKWEWISSGGDKCTQNATRGKWPEYRALTCAKSMCDCVDTGDPYAPIDTMGLTGGSWKSANIAVFDNPNFKKWWHTAISPLGGYHSRYPTHNALKTGVNIAEVVLKYIVNPGSTWACPERGADDDSDNRYHVPDYGGQHECCWQGSMKKCMQIAAMNDPEFRKQVALQYPARLPPWLRKIPNRTLKGLQKCISYESRCLPRKITIWGKGASKKVVGPGCLSSGHSFPAVNYGVALLKAISRKREDPARPAGSCRRKQKSELGESAPDVKKIEASLRRRSRWPSYLAHRAKANIKCGGCLTTAAPILQELGAKCFKHAICKSKVCEGKALQIGKCVKDAPKGSLKLGSYCWTHVSCQSNNCVGPKGSQGTCKLSMKDMARDKVIPPLVEILKGMLPRQISGSCPIHPLIEPTVKLALSGKWTGAVSNFILGMVDNPGLRSTLRPIVGALLKGDIRAFGKKLLLSMTTNSRNKTEANLMTHVFRYVLLHILQFNPCRMECVCRDMLGIILDRRFTMSARYVPFPGDPQKKYIGKVHEFNKLLNSTSSNTEASALFTRPAAIHKTLRDLANAQDPPFTCQRKPGPGPERDRDCILGTTTNKAILLRTFVGTKRIACQMNVFFRLDICSTCCCASAVIVTMTTDLAVDKADTCKDWFVIWDSIARGLFGAGRGLMVVQVNKKFRIKCDT